jgi:rSAM/selenodomain-associated transferase 2
MKLSVIIPALNKEKNIAKLITYLQQNSNSSVTEIILVDGGSTDTTAKIATQYGATVITAEIKSRAVQMNMGAEKATGDVLYFVHADVIPPSSFYTDISESVNQQYSIGAYRQKFDSNNPLFFINSFFTRYNKMWCRGGDQTIYITAELFKKLNGYNEAYVIMEEYDLMKRANVIAKFKVMPKYTIVSARKYEKNSWLKVMIANYKAIKMFRNNASPLEIKQFYNQALSK